MMTKNTRLFIAALLSFTGSAYGQILDPAAGPADTVGISAYRAYKTSLPPDVLVYAERMPKAAYDVQAYITANLNYPAEAKKAGIRGTVSVQFMVDERGKISHCRLIKRIGGGCDEEAIRLLEVMPPWVPAMENGKPVKVIYSYTLMFEPAN